MLEIKTFNSNIKKTFKNKNIIEKNNLNFNNYSLKAINNRFKPYISKLFKFCTCVFLFYLYYCYYTTYQILYYILIKVEKVTFSGYF